MIMIFEILSNVNELDLVYYMSFLGNTHMLKNLDLLCPEVSISNKPKSTARFNSKMSESF